MTSPISLVSCRWCGRRRSRGRSRHTNVGRAAARQLSQHGRGRAAPMGAMELRGGESETPAFFSVDPLRIARAVRTTADRHALINL